MSDPPSQYQNRGNYSAQEQRHGESQERPREQSQEQNAEAPRAPSLRDFSSTPYAQPIPESNKKSSFKLGTETRVAGKAGTTNISWLWTEIPLDGYNSGRYTFHTSPSNTLEVTIQQLSYRQTFTGNGTVTTEFIPRAPIGTKGKVIARDTVTGETLEVPYKWIPMYGLSGLWQTIKKLFWKFGK
jgi:hypothetical protein